MSEREDAGSPPLPGPVPPPPDLAAVSASIDPPSAPVPVPPSLPPTANAARPAAAVPVPAANPAPAAAPAPAVVRPSVEVAEVPAASRIPGAPAAGYGRLPTAPVATTMEGPKPPETESLETAEWASITPRPARSVVGPWALGLAIVALAASFAVGWMLPLGVIAIVLAIVALRRPVESRRVAGWAIALAAVSVLYSVGWLLWAAWVSGLLG